METHDVCRGHGQGLRSRHLTPERLEKHEQAASLVGSASIEGSLNQGSVSPDDHFDRQPHGSIGLWFESRQAVQILVDLPPDSPLTQPESVGSS